MGLVNIDRWARSLRDTVASLELPQNIEDAFGKYRDHPVQFVREILAAEIEPYQEEMLRACTEHPRIAIAAAHGTGKTTLLSWILLWWLLTRPYSRVLVCAPAFERQAGRYLLPEVSKWARRATVELPISVRAQSVEVVGYERQWFALTVQASDSSKVEGGHAESLCVLGDEAKGLNAEVVAGLHGTQTDKHGDRLYVLASVPGGPSGPFYDAFRKGLWKTFSVSAEESSLVSRQWIEERKLEWGERNPLYISRVLGQFPPKDDAHLFDLADLEAAVDRTLEQPEDVSVAFGVDVARFGSDRSAIAIWKGKKLEGVTTQDGPLDTMSTASWVSSEINRHQPNRVRVDVIGIGSGVADRLRQLGHKNIEDINVGSGARRNDLYLNLRAEVFHEFRDAIERGEVQLPADEGLLAELASIRYEYTPNGKLRLEEKAKTKRRAGRSPDKADAAVLGFAKMSAPIPDFNLGSVVSDLMTEGETWGCLDPDGRPASAGPWL